MKLYPVFICILLGIIALTAGCMQPPPSHPGSEVPSAVPTGPPAPNGTWTLVVFGDSRDIVKNTTTGVSPYLHPLAVAIAAEKPELVVFPGDLVSGWIISNSSPVATDYQAQFRNWMDTVAPIHNYTTGKGIPLYVMRGNHEDGPNQTVIPLLDAYLNSVAVDMPSNGPPGQEKLTYSFTYRGAKFIVLDQYYPNDGLKETVNQPWVDRELSTNTSPFTFVFGHTPAFLVKDDPEDRGYDIAVHPAQRDIFWNSLVNHHVTAYFCGHAHLYVRGMVNGTQQVVTGNGGAIDGAFNQSEADPSLIVEYPVKEADIVENTVGYIVITVNETAGTVSGIQNIYYPDTGIWKTGDRFTLSKKGAVIP
jgi:hypothetical protein